jgi:hypothetical protein
MDSNVVPLRPQDNHPSARDSDAFDHWVRYGIDAGFCSRRVCVTHEGTPYTEPEADAFDDGDDPCCPVLRIFET